MNESFLEFSARSGDEEHEELKVLLTDRGRQQSGEKIIPLDGSQMKQLASTDEPVETTEIPSEFPSIAHYVFHFPEFERAVMGENPTVEKVVEAARTLVEQVNSQSVEVVLIAPADELIANRMMRIIQSRLASVLRNAGRRGWIYSTSGGPVQVR